MSWDIFFYKHLGITLSSVCKWLNHINTIIEKKNIQTIVNSAKT